MFHLELRQFPHSAWRFNLSEQEVRAILVPWAREKTIEVGERKWNPEKATLTVLEGPKLELRQLSMGRGWREAQREGADVTALLLGRAREAAEVPSAGAGAPAAASAPDRQRSDVRVALRPLLGDDAAALLDAWLAAAAAATDLRPSESLAIAEEAIARRRGA